MNFKLNIEKVNEKLRELWKYKIFKIAIIVQLFYLVFSLIFTIFFLKDLSDFYVYYKSAGIFIEDITDLYNISNYPYAYRYFPLSPLIYVPFYLMGFDIGFLIFTLFNFFLNILICIILYKIIIIIRGEDHEKDDKRIILYICIYLTGLPHLANYYLGQNNLIVTLLTLLSLLIYLKYDGIKWQFFASLLLGIGIIIKPITIALIPFLLIINFNIKERKVEFKLSKSLVRVIGTLLPLSLNLIYFLSIPKLWDDFIATNFTGTNPVDINFSFSVTKLIINFFYSINIPFNQMLIFLIVLIIFGGSGFIIYVIRRKTQNSLIYGYTFGMLIMLLVYFDSWDHHLLNLTPLLIILIFNLPRKSKITEKSIKPSLMFFNYFDAVFVGVFVLIYTFFPFNFASTIFLILAFYGVSKNCIFRNDRQEISD